MRLKEAIELAKECGLSTVGEAIMNVEIHAISLFLYEKLTDELNELYTDFKESKYTLDDKLDAKELD